MLSGIFSFGFALALDILGHSVDNLGVDSAFLSQNKIPKQIVCLVGWLVATGLGLTVVYGIYTVTKPGGTSFNKAENVTYGTFSRFVWGLALAWVIYACQKGYGSKGISNCKYYFLVYTTHVNSAFCVF